MKQFDQDYITICIPFAGKSEWTALRVQEIEAMLDRLGNPVQEALKAKLDALNLVHFFSMNVLPWNSEERKAYIVIEATVDSDAKVAIQKISDAIGDFIFPVISRACALRSKGRLTRFLLKHHHRLRQDRMYMPWNGITGLPFNGKEGLTVDNIKRNEIIADQISGLMAADQDAIQSWGPIARFQHYKKQIIDWTEQQEENPKIDPDKARSLVFSDRKDAPWLPGKETSIWDRIETGMALVGGELKFIFVALLTFAVVAIGFSLNFFPVLVVIDVLHHFLVGGSSAYLSPSAAADMVKSALAVDDYSRGSIFFIVISQTAIFIATIGLALASSIVVCIGVIGILYAMLRWSETGSFANDSPFNPKRNYPLDLDPDPELVAEIMKRENHEGYMQNHMFHSVQMIKGRFRRIILSFAFRAVSRSLTSGIMRPGFLGDVGSAHAVRWFIPPGSDRLVFCGNYDGNWENYLEDFITKAPSGTSAIWSNSQGFPRTSNLFGEGAEDGDRLKRYARRTMMPSRCWYSAYPYLTAEQIRKQALIYDGLCRIGQRDSSSSQAWLSLFGSVPRPNSMLEHDKIQSMFYGNQSILDGALCIAANFGDVDDQRKSDIRQLLREEIVPRITFGKNLPKEEANYVAFSSAGLKKMGLSELFDTSDESFGEDGTNIGQQPSEFAPAFGMDMDASARQRLLDDPTPDEWLWGHGDKKADMVLLCYWKGDHQQVADRYHQWATILAKADISIVHSVDISHNRAAKKGFEPFGFRDGISQPIVRGANNHDIDKESIHCVEPGEFVLGYKDNRGYYPPTPHVRVSADQDNITEGYLPTLPDDMPQRYPSFSDKTTLRDFGRNGSYLVIRQLQQHVDAFDAFCEENAEKFGGAEQVGTFLMGRWKDGTPGIRNPDNLPNAKRTSPDNEFLFGDTDPQGMRCPLGSHIRRANPRDSLNIDNDKELSVSNRHRILRRGRPYCGDTASQSGTDHKGLLFMCLNSDIERQFEFIQSSWLNSTSFHGLSGESDPLMSPPDGKFSVPFSGGVRKMDGLSQFTTMLGGGYFFLPGKQSLLFLSASLEMPLGDELMQDHDAAIDVPLPTPGPPADIV